MEKIYFEDYGELDWLEPKDFWADGWSIVKTVNNYDIVVRNNEWRYTNI